MHCLSDCLQGQATAQADLIVWGGVGGGKGCDATVAPDVSNQWFTLKHGHMMAEADASQLLTPCKPDCCVAAAPCIAPACVWSAPLGWGVLFMVVFFAGGAIYAGGGSYYAARVQGKELKGPADVLTLHPHRSFWLSFAALAQDGQADCQARLAAYRDGGAYERLPTTDPKSETEDAGNQPTQSAAGPAASAATVTEAGGSGSDSDLVE